MDKTKAAVIVLCLAACPVIAADDDGAVPSKL
jgi:hypothetical protein